MRHQIKSFLEYISGYRAWLEPGSNLTEVRALIEQLKPVAIQRPLIRVGGDDDGGYLLPDDLEGITACVSPGVSTEVSFDLAMAKRGCEIFMADASVAGPPIDHPRFHFVQKFVDVFEGEQTLRLDTLCAAIGAEHSGDRLLQMDIEGAEFRVLLDASDETLKSFRIIAIEFHHLTRMFAQFPFTMIRATFQKLLRFHHVVHIHPNNVCGPTVRGNVSIPPVMEFTFYRKDRAKLDPTRRVTLPHPLDRDNVQGISTVPLPGCWK